MVTEATKGQENLFQGKENPGVVMRLKTMIDELCAAVACWGGGCCSVQWLSRHLATVAPMAALSWVFSFASVLLFIVAQNSFTQILLPLHTVTRILVLKLL